MRNLVQSELREVPLESKVAWYAPSVDSGDFCALDVETAGGVWAEFPRGFDLLLTGVRYGGAYHAYSADPVSLAILADFLERFTGVVVTFNGTGFDLPLLDTYFSQLLGRRLQVAHHYDVMQEIERQTQLRISLSRLSQCTFGEQKMPWDHRQNRRVWVEAPQRLIEYNRVDLDLTHQLYQRVLDGQHLFLGNATVLLTPPGPGASAP